MVRSSSMSLETFARLQAEIAACGDEGAVVRREGVDADSWRAARKKWLAKMASQMKRGKHGHLRSYVATVRESHPELLASCEGAEQLKRLREREPRLVRRAALAAALQLLGDGWAGRFASTPLTIRGAAPASEEPLWCLRREVRWRARLLSVWRCEQRESTSPGALRDEGEPPSKERLAR